MRKSEKQVREFYDTRGWNRQNESGATTDAQLWEDLRKCAQSYVASCRLRVMKFMPQNGQRILDAASGTIQYPEYLAYSRSFDARTCVDLSVKGLVEARKLLQNDGEYVCATILNLPFETGTFDAAVSLHTIYHIHKEDQERAVRELIRVTKEGRSIVIVYANPDRLLVRLKRAVRISGESRVPGPIYFYAHALSWWAQFSDECTVHIEIWRTLTAKESRLLIPSGWIGEKLFACLLRIEETYPTLTTRIGAYPMIVLKKRAKMKSTAGAQERDFGRI